MASLDSFKCRKTLVADGKTYTYTLKIQHGTNVYLTPDRFDLRVLSAAARADVHLVVVKPYAVADLLDLDTTDAVAVTVRDAGDVRGLLVEHRLRIDKKLGSGWLAIFSEQTPLDAGEAGVSQRATVILPRNDNTSTGQQRGLWRNLEACCLRIDQHVP